MAKDDTMTKAETKVPVTTETKTEAPPTAMQMWRPFENLRREVDRLFDDFNHEPVPAAVPKADVRHRALLVARVLGRPPGGRFRRTRQRL